MKIILNFCTRYWYAIHVHIPLCILFLISSISSGQTIITSGTTIKVIPSTTVISNENVILQNGGSINNQGTLVLKKDLENQNTSANFLGAGVLEFSGTGHQAIYGENVIQDLTVDNNSFNFFVFSIAGNTRVNGILTMINGLTYLENNLVLGPTATVTGVASNINMIVPTGIGQLQKIFSGLGSFTYPVGDMFGPEDYSPVTLVFNSGAFGATSIAGVNLVNDQYPGTGISYLNRYWTITQSGITGFSCNATFQYPVGDVLGTESDIFSFKVDPVLPWTAYNAADAGTHQLTIQGLSSFGTFTGNLGDASVPPAIRSLQDKIINSTMPECADASQTLLIAGNGTTYMVQSNGSVTHIAGQNIIYYPGTKVDPGGYMHGYISTEFCDPYIHPGAGSPVAVGTEDQTTPKGSNANFFKIYPNPTTGKFTLELKGNVAPSRVHVDIFGTLGESILSKDMLLGSKQEFSLIERPTGVYVVHVASGVNSGTEKIIKQ